MGKTGDRIFTPLVTLATFLSQVLSDDHSCRAAVARLLAWRAARGLPPCSPDTGGYCKARQRLPEALLPRLVRDTADGLQERAPDGWLFHGRRWSSSTARASACPTPPRTRRATPSTATRSRGCGFPIARVVVLLSLATGACSTWPWRRSGKLTGENALLRGLHGRLRRGDILLADSYYSSFTRSRRCSAWASTW